MRCETLQLLKVAFGSLGCGIVWLCSSVSAQDAPISPMALLFVQEESVLSGNVAHVARRMSQVPVGQRYDYFARWVLPSEGRPVIRTNAVFGQVAPPLVDGGAEATIRGVLSPVFAMLHAARQTGRLEALGRRVSAFPDFAEPSQVRAKWALLFMVHHLSGEDAAASEALAELSDLVAEREHNSDGSWWPETLALAYGVEFYGSDPAVFDLATAIYESQVRQGVGSGDSRWDVFVATCFAEVQPGLRASPESEAGTASLPQGLGFANWDVTSTFTAESRGQGFPPAVWRPSSNSLQKIGGHNNDLAYLPIPLTGDFEIQCDVTSFDYREIAMAYSGQYASHYWKLAGVEVGTIRDFEILPLSQPMTSPDAWLSSRMTVRDGVCTHYLNGHQVLQRRLPLGHFPWFGIRSSPMSQGAIKNLTLRGTPVVPEQVDMSSDPSLTGWYSCNDDAVADFTDRSSWNLVNVSGLQYEIRHGRNAGLSGSLAESVLFYHRPMVEDGVISYEFYYESGRTQVHPALGQTAFLLRPNGVDVHAISNGKWQRQGMHSSTSATGQHGSGQRPLPLQQNAWNQLQFVVQGNTVRLVLNGSSVFEQEMDAANCRQFGLFHFVDQTTARIRNVKWRGDWSKSVDLAGLLTAERVDTAEIEQATAGLVQSYQQQLSDSQGASGQFIHRGGPVDFSDGGLVTKATSANAGHRRTDAPLLLQVEGDFDLRASFVDFQHASVGDAGLEFLAILPSSGQKIRIARHRWDNSEHKLRTRISAITNAGREHQREVDHWSANQALSGTFRMVRIGTALHYLFAEGDSTIYRLLATDRVGREAIPVSGLCLTAFADKGGVATGTWTNVSVRADRVSGVAVPDLPAIREQLNIQATALSQSVDYDFASQPPDGRAFARWTDRRQWTAANKGLPLKATGSDHWESSGLSTSLPVVGDFDIRVEFDQLDLATPGDGHQTTLGLEIQPVGQPETLLNCLLGVNSIGTIEAEGYARIKMPDGSHWYSGTERCVVKSATALRIARRGNRYFMMVRPVGEQHDRIVSISDHSAAVIERLQVSLHTGGAGRESNVRLKSIRIQAE